MIITIEQLSQNFDNIHAAQVTAGKLMVCITCAVPTLHHSRVQVQIFASADCDSLCAASILVHVLKREHILYATQTHSAFFVLIIGFR
jgi:hypothetical protein